MAMLRCAGAVCKGLNCKNGKFSFVGSNVGLCSTPADRKRSAEFSLLSCSH